MHHKAFASVLLDHAKIVLILDLRHHIEPRRAQHVAVDEVVIGGGVTPAKFIAANTRGFGLAADRAMRALIGFGQARESDGAAA
jgi:microcompartment protein CcmK/EutM